MPSKIQKMCICALGSALNELTGFAAERGRKKKDLLSDLPKNMEAPLKMRRTLPGLLVLKNGVGKTVPVSFRTLFES